MSILPRTPARAQGGFGLIELMIGIVLGTVLILGLAEVFSASRNTYNTAQGSAEVQENGRFALDFLQRDVRMVGHMGCESDEARWVSAPPAFFSHFLTTTDRSTAANWSWMAPAISGGTKWTDTIATATNPAFVVRFDESVQGFEASGTGPGTSLTLATTGTWAGDSATPLPAGFPGTATPALPLPLPGSDIILLRFFGTDSAPATIAYAANQVIAPNFAAFATAEPNGYYGIASCVNASVFQATTVGAGGVITAAQSLGNQSIFSTGETYSFKDLTVYRAEVLAYYIATGADGNPSLWRVDYSSGSPVAQELVQGIDNMQILYGRDASPVVIPPGPQPSIPAGYVSEYDTATAVVTAAGANDPSYYWRRVGTARIALLARSSTLANTAPNAIGSPNGCATVANCYSMLGVSVTPPPDGNYREVYVTTIAMRNRLFGN